MRTFQTLTLGLVLAFPGCMAYERPPAPEIIFAHADEIFQSCICTATLPPRCLCGESSKAPPAQRPAQVPVPVPVPAP